MKSILTILTILLLSQHSKSQLTKGNWLAGGNISYASTKLNSELGTKNTFFIFQATPDIGYFIANKFATGIKATISSQGSKATGTDIYSKYTDASFGPFVRYYWLEAEKPFNLITEGSYQFGFAGGGQQNQRTSKNMFVIAAGPVIYFNSSVGLEFLIGYSSYKYSGFSGSNNTIQFGIGFQIHLEKDK